MQLSCTITQLFWAKPGNPRMERGRGGLEGDRGGGEGGREGEKEGERQGRTGGRGPSEAG